jgi:hypothetical protein
MTSDLISTANAGAPAHRGGLRVIDVMALIAVAAIGLGWLRSVGLAWVGSRPALAPGVPGLALRLVDATLPFLASGSLALLVLSLRRPRPPLWRLARRPGWLACAVASAVVPGATAGALVSALPVVLTRGPAAAGLTSSRFFDPLFDLLTDWGYLIGLAVAVAWVVLGYLGKWRSEPGWDDRLGRALGWGWVLLAPLATALRFKSLLDLLL